MFQSRVARKWESPAFLQAEGALEFARRQVRIATFPDAALVKPHLPLGQTQGFLAKSNSVSIRFGSAKPSSGNDFGHEDAKCADLSAHPSCRRENVR